MHEQDVFKKSSMDEKFGKVSLTTRKFKRSLISVVIHSSGNFPSGERFVFTMFRIVSSRSSKETI